VISGFFSSIHSSTRAVLLKPVLLKPVLLKQAIPLNMARTTKPLTNTEVKQAKPRDKMYTLSDGGGLQLRIKPNGSKLWLLDYYRPFTKKRTSLSLGTYPDVTLANARLGRDKAKTLLASDVDPQHHRDEHAQLAKEAANNTLKEVSLKWLKIKQTKVSEDHAQKLYRSLELHVMQELGSTPVDKIRAPQAIQALKPLAAQGSLETVKRVCQRLNEVMNFAVNSGLIEHNSLAKISEVFEAPDKQHLPTLTPDKLPELMKAVATASIKRTTRCLIEWQLHTMVRPSEAAGARWEEIDFESRLWTIPAERMKKKKEHIVPLSDQCIGLLEVMKPISQHREHVFPANNNPLTHANPSTANVALKRMGYGGQLVSHGMRSLASTTLNEQGFDPDIIESSLAHTDKNEVRKAYNRAKYLEQRRVLMAWWSGHIEQAATGNMSMANGSKSLKLVNG